ncbi:DUF4172 domain-containing protein [Chryseobacterium sp. NKUCC03_KSP]|uniref:DUF4172 domain-containing protein n=1 Tax=Chryseobacterium sp. NKUCC03_KSP TaxID=2842125 RepID=UPI001C5BEDF5|nr:DUF4172 domain-containing protein [Chryseobacterium sp. NKUCC03_KSP]MBW3521809.1 DUF4172 domain-containing protein [Chryseobacterium sp. NKUCC03_KSP]
MEYIWQSKDFPKFVFNKQEIVPLIQQFAHDLGEKNGIVMGFSEEKIKFLKPLQQEIYSTFPKLEFL